MQTLIWHPASKGILSSANNNPSQRWAIAYSRMSDLYFFHWILFRRLMVSVIIPAGESPGASCPGCLVPGFPGFGCEVPG